MANQTFKCDFGEGVTATMVVNVTRAFQGKKHVVNCEWSVPLTKEIGARVFPAYRRWLHSINQMVVDRTEKKMLYALQVSSEPRAIGGTWEMWVYKPHEPPELTVTVGEKGGER